MRLVGLLAMALLTVACSTQKTAADFGAIEQEFVYRSMAFSAVYASAQGLHKYEGQDFDRQLDDIGPRAIQKQRDYLIGIHKRLAALDKTSLPPEDRADYDIIDTQIGLALFDIDIAQSWRHNPQAYVELLGAALFNPLVLDYAPKPERFEHIIARLRLIPGFLDVARRQLSQVPPVWAEVAQQENEGNIDLIEKTLRAAVPGIQRSDFDGAAAPAIDSLRAFNRFLRNELPARSRGNDDWRLGHDHYAMKFKLNLATDRTPDQVLHDAEARLQQVRASMLELASPLHATLFPRHPNHPDLVIREVLDAIANKQSTPASYLDDARKDLEEAKEFVLAKNLLTMPRQTNLQVIPTPEFQRGVYSVGGFNPAPVFEPQLGAFFWVTPIPPNWPRERAISKLREYNFYNLKLLVIHEAMPGHYVQGEFANFIQPEARRALRSVYGNGPSVEGWAQYITQVLLDEGILGGAPELRLTLLKQELRVDANAILDIRLQTGRMTDDEAMQLMEKDTFQEHEEAVAKLQRAKLSSTQLPTYFVGWRDWLRVREQFLKTNPGTSLHDFHDRALKEGAVPLPILVQLLTGKSF